MGGLTFDTHIMEEIRSGQKLPIVERFVTISGEAPTMGQPMYLVRFSGCNLSCRYCDTPYRNEINEILTIAQLCDDIDRIRISYPGIIILFTGGEPLLEPRGTIVTDIAMRLHDVQFYVETNGSMMIDEAAPDNLHYVLDWKTPSAGGGETFCVDNLHRMRADHDVIKFVTDESDLPYIKEKIELIRSKNESIRVYLSPQTGKIELTKLADFILSNKLNAAISVQLHKIIWGEKRGV
ncbi:MAG: radical SAM protein [Spirochaetales bacterium]|nr:radical SAM protein [Spirochaetales bacterium]